MAEEKSWLPDEHLKALGQIIISFAYLEYLLKVNCGTLIISKLPHIGNVVTAELSFQNLLHLIVSIFKSTFKNKELQKRVEDLVNRIDNKIRPRRNMVAHSIWFPDSRGEKVKGEFVGRFKTTAKRRKGLDYQLEKYSAQDLWDIVSEIKDCTDGLDSLVKSVLPALSVFEEFDTGKHFPVEVEFKVDEKTGISHYWPKLSEREKKLEANIKRAIKKLHPKIPMNDET
jgi:hypothetical protein